MASLSRKAHLQQCCWELLDDLAFCSERYPRLAELAAEVLFEQQSAAPAMPVDPALEALVPF
ncbi:MULTISPECIES: hypothetical protein [unclassified Cyanobium]|uniref:hypothetical protein n=1 Tax=unclassified Cyanobium TaxID=2627006 RepID=UPI0020CDF57B|nr:MULTISPECIES: hypothetical protein [unclassified Cyanobium]MCP9857757.1 hypothetical protein [Cyanobium sp. Cruz-8H5]MCP9865185.1 hypothetical protein [Cyanobium sp. Cruz-8D1]